MLKNFFVCVGVCIVFCSFSFSQCVDHECSNDGDKSVENFGLGDEELSWDIIPDCNYPECYYEIGFERDKQLEPCLTSLSEPPVLVAGTPCVEPDSLAKLRVRACKDFGNEILCSENWSNMVKIIPYICWGLPGQDCQTQCYLGAYYRFEEHQEQSPQFTPCP